MLDSARTEQGLDFQTQSPAIGVIGAGVMGRGIVQVAALAGFPVRLYDADPAKCEASLAFVRDMIERAVTKAHLSRRQADDAIARIRIVSDLRDMRDASLIIEAIIEDLAIKQKLLHALEDAVSPDCVLATNTSSLMVTAIAAGCARPERVIGLHFFNPVPIMKLVEIIPGQRTLPPLVNALRGFVQRLGHTAVLASDTPGFLVNHAGRGLYTEGLRIVSEGIASPHDVDRAMRDGAGFRMGPFELLDLTGLDVSFPVMQQIYRQFFEEPRFRPMPFVARQHAAGLFGRKVGRGFYAYDGQTTIAPPESGPDRHATMPLWIDRETDGGVELRQRLSTMGLPLDEGAAPAPDSICIVAPFGIDATMTAASRGLDPERTIAIDTLLGLRTRWTMMTTIVTRPDVRDALHGMLLEAGIKVTVIGDSPGFVCQRVVATIINIACDIAQQDVAAPADIDVAVRIALAYPEGPLAMGDRVGAKTILTILDRMADFYRDPRYRASPWLRRRAELGLSLTHVSNSALRN